MEYVRTHNLALARNFLMGALSLSPSDPLILNEVMCRFDDLVVTAVQVSYRICVIRVCCKFYTGVGDSGVL